MSNTTTATARAGARPRTCSPPAREGARLPVFIEPNERFRLPADAARDVIMIGPGTGVAPFRGFVQERAATGAQRPQLAALRRPALPQRLPLPGRVAGGAQGRRAAPARPRLLARPGAQGLRAAPPARARPRTVRLARRRRAPLRLRRCHAHGAATCTRRCSTIVAEHGGKSAEDARGLPRTTCSSRAATRGTCTDGTSR